MIGCSIDKRESNAKTDLVSAKRRAKRPSNCGAELPRPVGPTAASSDAEWTNPRWRRFGRVGGRVRSMRVRAILNPFPFVWHIPIKPQNPMDEVVHSALQPGQSSVDR